MKETFRFGRIAGIDIGANWSLIVLIALVADGLGAVVLPEMAPGHAPAAYWSTAGISALLIAASLFLHELAHSLVALRNGLPVQRITLWMLGGVSVLGEAQQTRGPHTSQVVFPVVDLDGRPTGTVTLRRLAQVPATVRTSTRLADVQKPLKNVPTARPDDLLADLIARMAPDSDELALVIEHATAWMAWSPDTTSHGRSNSPRCPQPARSPALRDKSSNCPIARREGRRCPRTISRTAAGIWPGASAAAEVRWG